MEPTIHDKQMALDRAGGDPVTARRFLGMFIDLLARTEGLLAEALAHNNHADLKEHAHGLAGAALYCGASALHAAAKRLENQALAGDPGLNTALVGELTEQIAWFRSVIAPEDY
jgi:HPt (histidine-containing phosphotransfer) domain-containing protein